MSRLVSLPQIDLTDQLRLAEILIRIGMRGKLWS
jgi:hypothetical protein